ncbi:MAG: hypothetical protein A2126_00665 [Candidatus Woykebacteria bacterium GWB1_45_5]|uniref:Methylated-DNA-[protein]-cysteine S-methyltransferase DNA binding domain-containing protein n=2 Tax=Candidatus Woykeibacteriota TaxID=1817899 RepID=A0A1G1W3A6_9BACT|nr:MAG: hypothetical protein A2113_00945 [Candidatus Woykebacteria bacterium GWA1_44_8]OGY24232.1 MAG: hypothetical protein A2126_00665 [Candidatus Woykebacteria bacterium GWB1_45_5]
MNNRELVYKIVSLIPKGKVLTYAALAKLAGVKSPRLVGKILHQNKDPKNIPCHRVVNSRGEAATNYAFGGAGDQLKKLRAERIETIKSRVNLTKHLWQPINCLSSYFKLLRNYSEPGLLSGKEN